MHRAVAHTDLSQAMSTSPSLWAAPLAKGGHPRLEVAVGSWQTMALLALWP